MPLVLNEEQVLLKDSARDFFANKMPVKQLRTLRDNNDATGYSTESWQEIVALGWPGVAIPEAFGGLEFGYTGLGVVMEESGRTLAASPLFATCALGANLILFGGSEDQKSDLLPRVAQGELTLALAIEESSTHGPERTRAQATEDGDSFVLDGSKKYVLDGHSADQILVLARTSGSAGRSDGLTLFLVDPAASGVQIGRLQTMDARNWANIDLSGVRVPKSAVLGTIGQAAAPLQDALSAAQILLSAEMLGSTLECFERTIEYIKTRVQFDRAIGSLQAIQHRAAHMYSEIELAKSVVINALQALDQDTRGDELAKIASLTKAKLAEVFNLVSSEGVQMHGGIGMTDEEEIGFFLKRARATEHTLGDVRYHQNRYGALIGV
ncbi:MAG: acyl-CoA dehydrogenase family protein [Pseudomonadota bacterium]|nr:acyl-CoA dehydrogenase family protein [Pseudomonadota bacterium]